MSKKSSKQKSQKTSSLIVNGIDVSPFEGDDGMLPASMLCKSYRLAQNFLRFQHEDQAQIARLANAARTGKLFSEFVPIPDAERANRMESYDWCSRNWGSAMLEWERGFDICKAEDILISSGGKTVEFHFHSKAPPLSWYSKMKKQGFEILYAAYAHELFDSLACGSEGEEIYDSRRFRFEWTAESDELSDTLPEELIACVNPVAVFNYGDGIRCAEKFCSNYAIFHHEDPNEILRLKDAAENRKLLEEFMPFPAKLRNNESEMDNWCRKNWGTVFDIRDVGGMEISEDGKTIKIGFYTLDWPPRAWFRVLKGFKYLFYYYRRADDDIDMVRLGKMTDTTDVEQFDFLWDGEIGILNETIPKDILQVWDIASQMQTLDRDFDPEDGTYTGMKFWE